MKEPAVTDSDCADLGTALAAFEEAHPEFQSTHKLDELRASDYGRLDANGQVYLDYTGGGLYAESQLQRHQALLSTRVFGNPHSTNPTSLAMTELVDSCRRRVLDFFNASPAEYLVIFTLNASNALKLVGESYPFEKGGHFLLLFDNHNSVNGIREYCRAHDAETTYLPVLPPDMRADETMLERALASMGHDGGHNLFAYPAQSNFSGVQHPLAWIPKAQAEGWDVLLDAAAFVPTNRLDLGEWHPDFVALSFYKMFGYPTRSRSPHRSAASATQASAPLVCRGNDHRRVGPGRSVQHGGRGGRLRRRDGELSLPPGRGHRTPTPLFHRNRYHPPTGALPDLLDRRQFGGGAARQRHVSGSPLRNTFDEMARWNRHHEPSTMPTDRSSITFSSRPKRLRKGSRCAPAASAIRGQGRPRSSFRSPS